MKAGWGQHPVIRDRFDADRLSDLMRRWEISSALLVSPFSARRASGRRDPSSPGSALISMRAFTGHLTSGWR
ncbi:MAG: hypothetical protein D6723_05985 [Acidobacteria bacterium]|nr:MAG: hypothetical protein D6723_05985 [Acidobacteriota bacterium]